MFDTTHDAILLIVALLYVATGLIRARNYAAALAAGLQPNPLRRLSVGVWLSMPWWIATALAIVAVLW